MQHGDALGGAQSCQRGLQLQRLLDEVLDHRLAPEPQGAPTKATREALDSGEADSLDFTRVAVEQGDASSGEDLADLVLFTGFVVVIAEHRDNRYFCGGG